VNFATSLSKLDICSRLKPLIFLGFFVGVYEFSDFAKMSLSLGATLENWLLPLEVGSWVRKIAFGSCWVGSLILVNYEMNSSVFGA
jgi:hypothetical protein